MSRQVDFLEVVGDEVDAARGRLLAKCGAAMLACWCICDLSECASREQVIENLYSAIRAPMPSGMNFDAVSEWLADLTWLEFGPGPRFGSSEPDIILVEIRGLSEMSSSSLKEEVRTSLASAAQELVAMVPDPEYDFVGHVAFLIVV